MKTDQLASLANLREIAKFQSKKAAAKAQLNSKLKQPTIFTQQSVQPTEDSREQSGGFLTKSD